MLTTHHIGQAVGALCALYLLIALVSNCVYMLANPKGWAESDHWLFQKSLRARREKAVSLRITGLAGLCVIGYVLYDMFKPH